MIKVKTVYKPNMTAVSESAADVLEDALNDIVRTGGEILHITECGENYISNHYTIIYKE